MRAGFVRHLVFLLTAAALTAVRPAAAEPAQTPAGGSRVIVRVLSGSGEPLLDLKKEEISIRTDSRQREIRSLDIVRVTSDVAAKPAPPPLAAPYASNVAPAGSEAASRQFMILLDEDSIAPGREEPIRTAVGQLIAKSTPADLIGLLSLRIGGINLSPTTDHSSVREALARIVGGGSTRETLTDLACRTKRSLETFTDAFRRAPAGRTLVVISSGLAAPTAQKMATMKEETSDVCPLRAQDLEQVGMAATASAANLYVLHYPDGMGSTANVSIAQQGLENIAGVGGGEFIRIAGNTEPAMSRIARETSVYYLAILDEAGSGPMRRVDARVTRDGVKVHARPATPLGRGTGAPSGKPLSLRDMLATTAAFTDVPLRAAGFVSRQGAADMKLVTLIEPINAGTKLTAAAVGLVDDGGTLRFQWTAKAEDFARSPLVSALPLKPGRYRVRAVVTTDSGASGAVDYPLVAALEEAPPLKLGTMLLGIGQNGFTPKLQFSAQDQMAVGFLELYNVPKGAKVTTKFEIAEGETGPPLGEGDGNVGPGPGEDARITYGGFGITTLQPGDYIMRATISVDGKVVGKTTRTLRKVN